MRTDTMLSSLRTDLFHFATTPVAARCAYSGGREVWPLVFDTKPFEFESQTYDHVEMDESGKFYISAPATPETKIGTALASDCAALCMAVRETLHKMTIIES